MNKCPKCNYESEVNVDGDAYNYIINANYATAYFVLALVFVVFGSTFLILQAINHNRHFEGEDLK